MDEEENFLQPAMEAGIHINASCGGSATCGKCRIKLIQGTVDSPRHPKLTQWEYDKGYRLACLTSIHGDMDVEVPLESQVDRSVLALKGDRGTHKYLLSPQDIFQLVKGWDVDPPANAFKTELIGPEAAQALVKKKMVEYEQIMKELGRIKK